MQNRQIHDYITKSSRESSTEQVIELSLAFSNRILEEIEKGDPTSLVELIEAGAQANKYGENAFFWLAKSIHTAGDNKLPLNQLSNLTQPLIKLIKNADVNTFSRLIQAFARSAETGVHKNENVFYWLASAMSQSYFPELSTEQIITLTQPFTRLIEKADTNTLAIIVEACAKLPESGESRGINALCWLVGAIFNSALCELPAEQLMTLSQPFVSLVERVDANTFTALIEGCAKPAEIEYHRGKNAFYWLAVVMETGVSKKLSSEQLIILTRPFVSLIEKADANTFPMLIHSCSKTAETGSQKGKNAFYWLAKAIDIATSNKLSPEMLRSISKPLLLLLENVTTQEQVNQFTHAIEAAGALRPVRDQLKIYLIQNREHEDVVAKLARLKSYLDPTKPLHGFIAKNASSIFKKSETGIVKEIHAEISLLQQALSPARILPSNSANFSGQSSNIGL